MHIQQTGSACQTHTHTHSTQTHTAPLNVRKKPICFLKSLLWLPEYILLLCWPWQGYFLPQLACHQDIVLYCLVASLNGAHSGVFSGTFMEEWRGYSYHISVFLSLSKHSFGQHTYMPAVTHTQTHAHKKNTHWHFPCWPKRASQVHSSSQRFPPSSPNRQDPITSSWLLSLTEAEANIVIYFAKGTSWTFPEDIYNSAEKKNTTKVWMNFQQWNRLLLPKLFSQRPIWLTCSNKRGQTDQLGFLKGAGTLQQAPLIAPSLIHPVIIGNYLSISNVLMSPWCERQSNQGPLV